jgi:hypothetical protein
LTLSNLNTIELLSLAIICFVILLLAFLIIRLIIATIKDKKKNSPPTPPQETGTYQPEKISQSDRVRYKTITWKNNHKKIITRSIIVIGLLCYFLYSYPPTRQYISNSTSNLQFNIPTTQNQVPIYISSQPPTPSIRQSTPPTYEQFPHNTTNYFFNFTNTANITFDTTACKKKVVFKLSDIYDKSKYLYVYVNNNSTVTTKIPVGIYDVYYATGYFWQNNKDLFGYDTRYYKFNKTITITSLSYGSLEIHDTLFDDEGNTDTTTKKEFFNND